MLSNANNTPKPESKNSTGDYINPDVTLPRATTIVGNFVKEGQEKITTSLDLLFSTKAGETSPQEFALHSDIQKNMARKYINGLLHICHCTADKSVKKQLKKDTLNLWNRFIAIPIPTDNDVKILENDLAICLMKALHKHFPNIDLEHAHKQVTMARDLVILLNKINPTESDYIVTQKKHTLHGNVKKKLNILEKTAYLKVSEQYYEKFLEKDNPSSLAKKWLESTLKYAGFHKKAKNTWIQNLLTLYKDEFIQAGVSISSSGRWHFLPGNLREHSIQVTEVDAKDAKEQKEFEPPPANVNKVSVVAMGTVCAFNADKSIQEELALEQLDEVYQLHRQKKAEYKKLYGSLADTFYFNYQTILSPVAADHALALVPNFIYKHKDNNTRFVAMAKKTIQKLSDKYPDDNVEFTHTNAAVNKLTPISTEYRADNDTRQLKIKSTANLLKKLADKATYVTEEDVLHLRSFAKYLEAPPGSRHEKNTKQLLTLGRESIAVIKHLNLGKPLENEVIMRMRASYCLKRLLEHPDHFPDLSGFGLSTNHKKYFMNSNHYKRNILISALEILSQGSQSLSVLGCKSARDRTAIVLCAVKALMLNPTKMLDWRVINRDIVKGLNQGHHFRAMQHHCGMVKIDDVHVDFLDQISDRLKDIIEHTKKFAKTLSSYFSRRQKLGIALFAAASIAGVVLLFLFPPAGIASLLGVGYLGAEICIGAAIGAGVLFTGFKVAKSLALHIFKETAKLASSKIIGTVVGIGAAIALTTFFSIPMAFVGIACGIGFLTTKVVSWLNKRNPGEDPNNPPLKPIREDIVEEQGWDFTKKTPSSYVGLGNHFTIPTPGEHPLLDDSEQPQASKDVDNGLNLISLIPASGHRLTRGSPPS